MSNESSAASGENAHSHYGKQESFSKDDAPGNVPIEKSHGNVIALTPAVFDDLKVTPRKTKAAGTPAVIKSTKMTFSLAGMIRGTYALAKLNQKGGIDCPSCAWPDPDGKRKAAEFCENGAKALAHEMDRRKVDAEFFQKYPVAELSRRSDYWLEQQGRLTQPMYLKPGGMHYRPIAWDAAIALIADRLRALPSPNNASFYTSGRASNEAAFAYQLFVRQFGTNNLPDCSNMCHESSGSALTPTIGIGKGTVTLEDFEKTELIIIMGQNPGTNHPRMLTSLEEAKHNGAKIIAVNPLPEAGLIAFMNPQHVSGLLGKSTPLADLFLQVKINGDIALLKGIMKLMLEAEDRQPGSAFDLDFIREKTAGIDALLPTLRDASWDEIINDSGITREQITEAAALVMKSSRIIICWAMGMTQHVNAVGGIQEIVNLLLLRGSIGKPGAGACPVRGHSNVQGDRTMGIWEKPTPELLEKLEANFNFSPPREKGFDVVESIHAMHAGDVKVWIQLGGNFLSATPDTDFTAEGLSKLDLSVRIGTKLNRSDLVVGNEAIILPCLGRSEIDAGASEEQFVTTENSMGVVQMSKGKFAPASDQLRGETAILCQIAQATLGSKSTVDWQAWAANYDNVRDAIAQTIPGCDNYNQKVRQPGGFYLPNKARDNEYKTSTGRANFTVNPIPQRTVAPGHLILMTIRSHDQFNTTIYALDDRYRGIHNERRVILMNEVDIKSLGLSPRQAVDITSHFHDQKRIAPSFIIVPYDIAKGCFAVYFPEGNVLVPIGAVAEKSNTPVSKFIDVTIAAAKKQEKFDYDHAAPATS